MSFYICGTNYISVKFIILRLTHTLDLKFKIKVYIRTTNPRTDNLKAMTFASAIYQTKRFSTRNRFSDQPRVEERSFYFNNGLRA